MELMLVPFGGLWGLKERIVGTKPGRIRSFYLAVYYLYQKRTGCYVGHSAIFSGKPCFPHGLKGVFIAGGARFGVNCVIFQNVTVGSNPLPSSKRTGIPIVGNNVYIGAGAAIIGNITVGDNCRIGANCTVFESVEPNCVVVTAPPRIIKKEETLDNRYYKWSANGPLYYDNGEWILEKDAGVIRALDGRL